MPPIRVGFVLLSMNVAGAEVLVAETIRRLGSHIEPTVLCLDSVGTLGEQLESQGVPVVSFDRKPGRDWRIAVLLAREIARRRIQVVHAHQYTAFFYSAFARLLLAGRPRLIFTEHGRHYPDTVKRMRRTMNRWVLARLATSANAVCQFSAAALKSIEGFSEVEVIENGIDPDSYGRATDVTAARGRLRLDAGKRYIACVARLHPVKDHATLIEAFRRVVVTHPDAHLLLVGDGALRPTLEAQAARLQIDSSVTFLGIRHDVAAILGASDVFLPAVNHRSGVAHAPRSHGVRLAGRGRGRRRKSGDRAQWRGRPSGAAPGRRGACQCPACGAWRPRHGSTIWRSRSPAVW